MTTVKNIWLHRFALLLSGTTLFLVAAGASVTSTGSGLAVPDWPLSYGTLFPPMEGGIFFEHGHRMIAGVVLILTTVLTIWLFRREERAWLRRLGLVGLLALLVQALLGGLTVLFLLPTPISVSHAGLAMAFFCLTVGIALFTSPGWQTGRNRAENHGESSLRDLSLVTTGVIYVQILLGAVMRHTGAGLAIPDFPLAFGRLFPPVLSPAILIHFSHRLGALAVTVLVVVLIVRTVRNHRTEKEFLRPALALAGLLAAQLVLGAMTIWTARAVVPTTAHVAVGAAVLACSLVHTLQCCRLLPSPERKRRGLESPSPATSMGR